MVTIKNKKCSILFPVDIKEDMIAVINEKIRASDNMDNQKIDEISFDLSRITNIDFFGFQYMYLMYKKFIDENRKIVLTEKSETLKKFEITIGVEI